MTQVEEGRASQPQARNSKLDWSALYDLLIIVTALVVVKQTFIPITIVFAGPISTLTAMMVATWRLRARGLGWRDLGVRRPDSWGKTLLWAFFVIALIILTSALGGALADLIWEQQPKTNRFGDITGDWAAFAMYLVLIWTHAAFFEELLFRAFLINRLEAYFGELKWATPVAVVLAACFFGYRHYYYQGMNGAVATGLIGLSLGIYYVRRGRHNMWPQFLAHGFINTLGFTFRVLGIEDD